MIYFLRTRHDYAPYRDWFRLAELSGFPIIYFDEVVTVDSPFNTYIATPSTGEWGHWQKRHTMGKLIFYQLEHEVDGQNPVLPSVDETWCGDSYEARKSGYRYVPLGSHPGLNELWDEHSGGTEFNVAKSLDVSMLSYMVYRRQHVYNTLKDTPFRMGSEGGLWGKERSLELLASRMMVHIHQWENIRAVAPLRWCITAAHKLPMITETLEDAGVYGKTRMIQSEYEPIAENVKEWLKDEHRNKLEDYACNLYDLLCVRYRFADMVYNNL